MEATFSPRRHTNSLTFQGTIYSKIKKTVYEKLRWVGVLPIAHKSIKSIICHECRNIVILIEGQKALVFHRAPHTPTPFAQSVFDLQAFMDKCQHPLQLIMPPAA